MLALSTGWTPDVLGSLSGTFRAACHWALYGLAISGPEGLSDVPMPDGANAAQRLEIGKARAAIGQSRRILFPGDD